MMVDSIDPAGPIYRIASGRWPRRMAPHRRRRRRRRRLLISSTAVCWRLFLTTDTHTHTHTHAHTHEKGPKQEETHTERERERERENATGGDCCLQRATSLPPTTTLTPIVYPKAVPRHVPFPDINLSVHRGLRGHPYWSMLSSSTIHSH